MSCDGYSSHWFTKGDSASGATADITNFSATNSVAWSSENSGDTTHTVMEKAANTLGVYDMSGNIVEYTFDGAHSSDRSYFYGGDYSRAGLFLQIGRIGSNVPNYEYKSLGFRMGRSL